MILLIDKPKGLTSHDVVDLIRKKFNERRVGHAGTLDPNATGLLIIGVSRESTKKLGEIAKNTKKIYEAEIFLGETRETDDVEGKLVKKFENFREPTLVEVKKKLGEMIGKQMQIPPVYSAIKLSGKKAYELARKGKTVDLKPRIVEIEKIEVTHYQFPIIKMKCVVSSGTYIRAIARDLGEKLGSGAYLKNLRRTKIGEFDVKDAVKLDDL